MTQALKVGLVLTGGGARAAYQVGALDALAELPVEIAAVSAVGAGALNGALVAACADAPTAAKALRHLWSQTIQAEESAIRLGPVPVMRLGTYLTLLFAGGVTPEIEEKLKGAVRTTQHARHRQSAGDMAGGDPLEILLSLAAELLNVTTDADLDAYLSAMFVSAAAAPRRPFFVSVYETDAGLLTPLKHALELGGLLEVGAPKYIEVSDPHLAVNHRLDAVLASATLPFVCETRGVWDRQFIDGSFGGMNRSPGAVPIQPLLRQDARKLDAIVVVHTESGVAWNANELEDTPVIEIRPSQISENVAVGYFWPDKEALGSWVTLGASDTRETLGKWLETTGRWDRATIARNRLIEGSKWLDDE